MYKRTVTACLLTFVLAGCACRQPVPPKCPQLPPIPANLKEPRKADNLQWLESWLQGSPSATR